MNKEWDLSPLYEGFDTEKYQNDRKVLTETAAAYNAFAADLPADRAAGIRRGLELQEKLNSLAAPLFEYASLRSAVNTSDSEALDAFLRLCRAEGILPALESSHALAYVLRQAGAFPKGSRVLVNLSGRGDKDMDIIEKELGL